ncbi:hypothetical protein LguiA_022121 [Lonicera macranthoides]
MSDYLPQDALIDILTRLPLKNIVQCITVCKSWYALITSPNFRNTHLNLSISKKESRLLIRESVEKARTGIDNVQSGKEYFSVHWDDETFDGYAKFDFPYSSFTGYLRIVGSCNGLVLFSDDRVCGTKTLYLWNPSIRKFVTLPRPIVTSSSHGAYMHTVGFGFHANDYKVVRVVHLLREEQGGRITVPPEVEIYELSTGSWRTISVGKFSCVILQCGPQAFLNGVVHWFGTIRNKGKRKTSQLIVSFDMKNEQLGSMMLPACAEHYWDWEMRVAVYGDLLSLIHKPKDEVSCYIWVMKEYGVEKSWSKQFTIDLKQVNFAREYFFRENGDILMAPSRGSTPYYYADGNLISYDPNSKQIKRLRVHEKIGLFYVVTYMESLALLEGLNGGLRRHEDLGMEASFLPKEEVGS